MRRRHISSIKAAAADSPRGDRWRFLSIFLILGTLIAGGILVIYSGQLRDYSAKVVFEEQADLAIQEEVIARRIDDVVTDLIFLSRASCLREGLGTGDHTNTQQTFLIFADSKKRYSQIRYLDEEGQELVRVNMEAGVPVSVTGENLQNKASRYYFSETKALGVGEIYVSPMDLNVEQGVIDDPPNPMVRFSTPIFEDGVFRGVLVINYYAGALLEELKSLGNRNLGGFYLLNTDGYYLAATEPADEWGFMFPGGENLRFDVQHPDDWVAVRSSELLEEKNKRRTLVSRHIHPLGDRGNPDYFWIAVNLVPEEEIREATGAIRGRLFLLGSFLFLLSAAPAWAISQIISRRARMQKELYLAANYDDLTGLPNRQLGMDRLSQTLKRCRRYGSSGALFFIDLDGFKAVNDVHGHEAGDLLLKSVGERLTEALRQTDTASRYGGDEFFVLTPFDRSEGNLERIAVKIVEAVSQPYRLRGVDVTIGASVGVRRITGASGETPESLIREADGAMYESKKAGKGRYTVFEASEES